MRTSWWLGGAALIVLAPFACSSSFTAEAAGGGGGSSTSSNGAGTVTGFVCDTAKDCPPATSQCETIDCVQGQCVDHPTPSGAAVPNPIYGNCTAEVCDGAGNQSTAPDDKDTYDDGNPCTADACVNHQPSNAPQIGLTCRIAGGGGDGVCDAAGSCVQCNTSNDCRSDVTHPICQDGHCIAATCTDGIKAVPETDVDCGGPDCPPCLDGKVCSKDADCASKVCTDSSCTASTCTDKTRNGHETDTDCGGPDCPKCADHKDCTAPSDCQSGVCHGGTCDPRSCSDGVQNGDESDVDCGGTTSGCEPCPDGKSCTADGDCETGNCDDAMKCNHCDDGKQDFGESDNDCGASCAIEMGALCADGKHCSRDEDCMSDNCCNGGPPGQGTCAAHCPN